MKKVLICGATGFIGRNTAEYLAAQGEYEVYGTYFKSIPYVNPSIRMVQADLTDPRSVDRVVQGMDIIIQAAAVTSGAKDILTKPHTHVTDNAVMNSYIFRSAYEHKVKHVFFFSCAIFYQSSSVPIKEADFDANQEIIPAYFGAGWTKLYNEKMCEFYSRIGVTQYTVIRHSNIYGPYDKYDLNKSHVFGATMTKVMMAQENGEITVWGTGDEGRDFLYVSDLVNFIDMALQRQKSKFELVNVGYGSVLTVKDLVKKLVEASGKRTLTITYDTSKPTIKMTVCLDISKTKNIFGWSPTTTIDQGIQKTMSWYKNYSQASVV